MSKIFLEYSPINYLCYGKRSEQVFDVFALSSWCFWINTKFFKLHIFHDINTWIKLDVSRNKFKCYLINLDVNWINLYKNVFQLSYGMKNIHERKLCQQHTLGTKFFVDATFEGL